MIRAKTAPATLRLGRAAITIAGALALMIVPLHVLGSDAPQWSAQELVSTSSQWYINCCDVRLDGHSRGFISWMDPGRSQALVARGFPNSGWEVHQLNSNPPGIPSMAVNGRGQAFVVWSEARVVGYAFATYVPGTGWSSGGSIDTGAADHRYGPWTVIADDGQAAAVWAQVTSAETDRPWAESPDAIGVALLDRAGGMARGETISGGPAGRVSSPLSVFIASGALVVVWTSEGGSVPSGVMSALSIPGSGWADGGEIPENGSLGLVPRALWALGADGAQLMSYQDRENVTDLLVSDYQPGEGWQTPFRVASGNRSAFRESGPLVHATSGDRAMIVWREVAGNSTESALWCAVYQPGSGWRPSTMMAQSSHLYPLALASDGNDGFLLLTDNRYDADATSYGTHRSHFTFGGGWSALATLATSPDLRNNALIHDSAIVSDSRGNMLGVTGPGYDYSPNRGIRASWLIVDSSEFVDDIPVAAWPDPLPVVVALGSAATAAVLVVHRIRRRRQFEVWRRGEPPEANSEGRQPPIRRR